MSDATADEAGVEDDAVVKKSSKLPLIIGLVLALAGGGGGFFAAFSGLLPVGGHSEPDATDGARGGSAEANSAPVPIGDVAFLEMDQLVVSMGTTTNMNHLRFRASLEVDKAYLADVETLLPRILDVLNNYLRALEPGDLEAPGALIKLRSQMLRRIQLVTGEGRVRDLLVMEFVLT